MKLPKKVKVGSLSYQLAVWPSNEATAAERYGECDRMNLIIRYRDDIPDDMLREVVFHEILHAVYSFMEIDQTSDEEKQVSKMTKGLNMVFLDNPKLKDVLF
jgi:hypothetical protein